MIAEILFFVVLFGVLLFSKKKSGSVWENLKDPLYIAWFLMSLSIFNYTPSILQYIIRISAIIYSVIIIKKQINTFVLQRKKAMDFLLFYLLICAASILWSVNGIQTAVKVVEIFVDLFLIAAICKKEGSYEAFDKMMKTLMCTCIVVQISIFIGMLFFPGTYFSSSRGALGVKLTGGIVSANSVGGICVFTLICLLNTYQMSHKKIYFIISVIELVLCQARTSMVSILLVMIIYAIKSRNKIAYLGVAFCALIAVYLNFDFFSAYFLRGTDPLNMQTMSGRTVMWENAKLLIKQKPLLGYGFGAGGEIVSKLNNGMTSLHSGIYECIMGVGYIGFILLVLTYVCVLVYYFKMVIKYGIKNMIFDGMLLIDLSIRTYMSTGIGGWHSHTIMVWFLLVASMSRGYVISLDINERFNPPAIQGRIE